MSSRKYTGRAITLDSIGTISDIIKNLIKIDTEERIEKSKEDIHSYYQQRQDLNKRIARTQRRRTELLAEVYRQHKEEIDETQSEEVQGQISFVQTEQKVDFSVESAGLEKPINSTVSLGPSSDDIEKEDLKNESPEATDNSSLCTVDCETFASFIPLSGIFTGEAMLLYRVPQQVIRAKTELSLKLRKRSKNRRDSAHSIRDPSKEKKSKESGDKHKRDKHADNSDKKTTAGHVSKKDEFGPASSKSNHKQQQQQHFHKDKSPNKEEDHKHKASFQKPTELHLGKMEPGHISKKKVHNNSQNVEATGGGNILKIKKSHEKRQSVKNEEELNENSYLLQKSRGQHDDDLMDSCDRNDLHAARKKLSKTPKDHHSKDENQNELSHGNKVKIKKKVTSDSKQQNHREPNDYERTMARILKAKEKIRKEFDEFEKRQQLMEKQQLQLQKPTMNLIKVSNANDPNKMMTNKPMMNIMKINDQKTATHTLKKPMMNLIKVAEANINLAKETNLQPKSVKNRHGEMVVESISTSVEIFDENKQNKPKKTANIDNEKAEFTHYEAKNRKKKSSERNHSYRVAANDATDSKKFSCTSSDSSKALSSDRKQSIKYKNQHYSNNSDEITGFEKAENAAVASDHRRSRRTTRKLQESCAPKLACPGGDSSEKGPIFVRRKSPVYIKPSRDEFATRKSSKPTGTSSAEANNPFPVKLRHTGALDYERRSRTVGPCVFRRHVTERKHSFSEVEAEESHGHGHARIDEKELSEGERVMMEKKAKQEDDEADRLRAYEEQRRIDREKEEEELRQLKEKQERRRLEREEEERLMAERRVQEEERRKEEEEVRRKKLEADKSKKDAEKLKRQQMQLSTGPLNIQKKEKGQESSFDKFGNIVRAKAEMGLTKDQHEEQKRRFLAEIHKDTDLDGIDTATLKHKLKDMHHRISRLEGDKYDLEQRHQRQEYDLKELNERQRQIARNKALKKGLDPNEAPKVAVVSKYDRQVDRRTFTERKKLYDVDHAIPHFPNIPAPTLEMEKVIKPYAKKDEDEENAEEEEE